MFGIVCGCMVLFAVGCWLLRNDFDGLRWGLMWVLVLVFVGTGVFASFIWCYGLTLGLVGWVLCCGVVCCLLGSWLGFLVWSVGCSRLRVFRPFGCLSLGFEWNDLVVVVSILWFATGFWRVYGGFSC